LIAALQEAEGRRARSPGLCGFLACQRFLAPRFQTARLRRSSPGGIERLG
jgi:hypothetical protein